MAYVITDDCTTCLSCVDVCPTESIKEFDGEAQVFINPDTCTDCGACEAECPSGAIFADFDLAEDKKQFIQINASKY